jgi:hypothetical protein
LEKISYKSGATLTTTKAKLSGQALELNCKIRANSLAPNIIRDSVVKEATLIPKSNFFWKRAVLEASSPAQSPAPGSANLHVRGSQVNPAGEPEQIGYRIDLAESRAGLSLQAGLAFAF